MRKEMLLLPETKRVLAQVGEQIKLARLRRNLTMALVAERARISRQTLSEIEKGNPSIGIGYYASVLHALGYLEKDLLLIAQEDTQGREIQDMNLPTRARASKRRKW